LSQIYLPTLSEETQREIGGDITLEEVQQAIKRLSSWKSPGDDGIPAHFCKELSDIVAPKFLTVFQDALKRKPENMQSAVITLIHKKGKIPQQCRSYCPVSLIEDFGYKASATLTKSYPCGSSGFY